VRRFDVVTAIKRHKQQQASNRLMWGAAYQDHDLVLCRDDGRPCEIRAENLERAIIDSGQNVVK
jgi:hypothetical protein